MGPQLADIIYVNCTIWKSPLFGKLQLVQFFTRVFNTLGYEIQSFKTGLFEDKILNGPIFKESGYNQIKSHCPNHSKFGRFCPDLKWFLKNGGHLTGFKMVRLPNFISHSISEPFANLPFIPFIRNPDVSRFQFTTDQSGI